MARAAARQLTERLPEAAAGACVEFLYGPLAADPHRREAELGVALFVRDTPTLFVNGRRRTGFVPRAALEEAVERERRAASLTLRSEKAREICVTPRISVRAPTKATSKLSLMRKLPAAQNPRPSSTRPETSWIHQPGT